MNVYQDIRVSPFEVLCITLAEELLEKGLVNRKRFTFMDVWTLSLRMPGFTGRRITPAISKQVVRTILESLVLLEVLVYSHGVYRFASTDVEEWRENVVAPYREYFLALKAHPTIQ